MKTIMCGLVAAMISTAAHAQEPVLWSKVGDWTVKVDRVLGNGCFAYAIYEDNTGLRVGFSPFDNSAHFFVVDHNWASLEVGKEYELEVQFDSREPWRRTATVEFEHSLLVEVDTEWPVLLEEFARSHVLVMRYMGKEFVRLSLRGSRAALDEVFKCQVAMESSRGNNLPA